MNPRMSILVVPFFLIIFCVCGAKADIDLETTQPLKDPLVLKEDPYVTYQQMQKILPQDMKPTDNQGVVFAGVADRGLNEWLKSDSMKNSPLVQTVDETQQKLKTDVVVNQNTTDPDVVQHKFSFKVEAIQALAKMEYTGWTHAIVAYDAKASETKFEIHKQLFADKDLILAHKAREGTSTVGVGWKW